MTAAMDCDLHFSHTFCLFKLYSSSFFNKIIFLIYLLMKRQSRLRWFGHVQRRVTDVPITQSKLN